MTAADRKEHSAPVTKSSGGQPRSRGAGEEPGMTEIELKVAPDRTPEEEAELVAQVAASYAESTGVSPDEVKVTLTETEEVDYRAVSHRTGLSARWT